MTESVVEPEPTEEVDPFAAPLFQDPFRPVLFNSPPLDVTVEQQKWLMELLEVASSDTQFAKKAFDGIMYILTHGVEPEPQEENGTPEGSTYASGTKVPVTTVSAATAKPSTALPPTTPVKK